MTPKPKALSIIIDSNEPPWVQELDFADTPTSVSGLPTGDVWVALHNELIVIERKTMSDLLASINDGRLFAQAAEMADASKWAYVVLHDKPHGFALNPAPDPQVPFTCQPFLF